MQTIESNDKTQRSKDGRQVPSPRKDYENYGKMTLYVKSRKTVVANLVSNMPASMGLSTGPLGYSMQRVVVREQVLDDLQKNMIRDCEILSKGLGIKLHVVDLSKSNWVSRFFGYLTGNHQVQPMPTVQLDKEAVESLIRDERIRLENC